MYKLKMQQEIETCVQSTCFVAQIKKEKNALCLWKIMDMFLGQNSKKNMWMHFLVLLQTVRY